jgi:hypothetical protein
MDVQQIVNDHPLIAIALGAFFLLALVLGVLHEIHLFGECLLVFVRHFKVELLAVKDVGRRLKDELRTWKGDP